MRQRGFTLVELLVAMTLLGLVSLMLFGGLRFGTRAWDSVVASSADRDRIVAAQRFLRQRLGGATAPGGRRQREISHALAVEGSDGEIAFTAPWMTALAYPGLYRFTLGHDEGALVLSWQPDGEAETGTTEDRTGARVLLDDVSALRLRYYGWPEDGDTPEWLDAWADAQTPPLLVGIDVEFSDPALYWPGFVVAPQF